MLYGLLGAAAFVRDLSLSEKSPDLGKGLGTGYSLRLFMGMVAGYLVYAAEREQ
jgi:hypothetical protein